MALTKVNATNIIEGILPVANGGTGSTTTTGAANAILPTQTGNSGKYLTTNGTDTSWGTVTSNPGTVTSITAGTGLSGGTITSSGTIAIDSTVATLTGVQTLTNKTISGASNTLSNIGNASLTNSAITINGTSTSLGGSISVGTVTSVTGTAPVVSSGGATPAISMAAATASVNGYMTSTYASKLDGIAAGATNVTNNNQIANGAGYTTNTGTVTSVSGTGTVSGLSLSGTVTTSGSLTLGGTLAVTSANLPAGSILQVSQATQPALFTNSSASWVDFTGLSVTITPKNSSSRFLLKFTSGFGNDTSNSFQYARLVRNSTPISIGDASGSVTQASCDGGWGTGGLQDIYLRPATVNFVDSPATASAITYKVQVIRTNAGTTYWGRTVSTTDANRSAISSNFIVMEIAG